MKEFDSLELLDGVDEKFIASAENTRKRTPFLKAALPVAAALCLAAGALFAVKAAVGGKEKPDVTAMYSEPAVTETAGSVLTAAPTPSHEPSATPVPENAFIVQGIPHDGFTEGDLRDRSFTFNDRDYSLLAVCPQYSEFFGDAVGELPSGQYLKGNVFAFNGYDPELLLCRRGSNGEAEVFISDVGMVLFSGADVFEDRLLLRDEIETIGYLDRSIEPKFEVPYFISLDSPEYAEAIEDFITAIDEGKWISREFTRIDADMLIVLKNGLRLRLVVSESGIVSFDYGTEAFINCSIKVDPEKLRPLLMLVSEKKGKSKGYDWSSEYFTIEALMNDPVYGEYIPQAIPNGFKCWRMHIFYSFDPVSGKLIGPDYIEMSYTKNKESIDISLDIIPKDRLEEHWPFYIWGDNGQTYITRNKIAVPLEEFTEDDILFSSFIKESETDLTCYAAAYKDDIAFCITAEYYDTIAADISCIIEILESVNR